MYIAVFLAGFCALFYGAQNVLRNQWARSEDEYYANLQYEQEPEDSIDVLFFGTSEMHNSISPMAIYRDTGITSWNFAGSWSSSLTDYYMLQYALKHQHPKVVVCDFAALFKEETSENAYWRAYDNMPDREIARAMAEEIVRWEPDQDKLEFRFPLLHYHSMWSSLRVSQFLPRGVSDGYHSFFKGAYLVDQDYNDHLSKVDESLWHSGSNIESVPEINEYYYGKFIELCRDNNCHVLVYYATAPGEGYLAAASRAKAYEFLQTRGVLTYDFNNYQSYQELGLVLHTDYFDETHVNIYGAEKLSEAMADALNNDYYELPDHRGEYAVWDLEAEKYQQWVDSLQR